MKTNLFKFGGAVIISGLIFSACNKTLESSPSTAGNGVINLDVLYTCNQCPGSRYDLKVTNDTVLYHISNDLTQFGITSDTKFPINVNVNWKIDSAVSTNFVTITALKVNN